MTRRFTFEERRTNPTDLPKYWIRAQNDPPSRVRPGFPLWNRAELDYTVSRTGEGSVRLPTRGGAASLLLDPGVVPVFPEADYTVIASVRTDEVAHARARLVARLLDSEGNPIAGSEVSSAPVSTRGAWKQVMLRLLGDDPSAASLQVELLLEQPGPVGVIPYRELEVVPEDFTGSAWFDDIAVLQVPRVEIWADAPGNLFEADERPAVSLFLRDLVGQELGVMLRAFDLGGRVVASERIAFPGGRLEQTWTPDLDRHGWYRVGVTVTQEGVTVGSASMDMVWRGPRRGAGDRPAPSDTILELSIDGVPSGGMRELGDFVLAAGVPRITTDLWFEGGRPDRERIDAVSLLANRLFPRGRELGLSIGSLPPEIEGFGGLDGIFSALASDESDGAAWLDPLMIELGHRVRRWRFGEPDESVGAYAVGLLDPVNRRLHDLVPGAVMILPVSPFDSLPPALVTGGVTVARGVVGPVPIEEIGNVLGEFGVMAESAGGGWSGPEQVAVVNSDDAERVGRRASIDRLVLATLHAKLAFDEGGTGTPSAVRLDSGWRWQDGRHAELMPEPASAAWMTMSDLFAGRQAERLERVAPGVSGVLLAPASIASGRSAVAAFWAEPEPGAPRTLSLRLAQGDVTEIDQAGNERTVRPTPIGDTDRLVHEINLSGGAVFVEGVDADLLRFLASVTTDPGMIETTVAGDKFEVLASNPWPGPVQGQYFLVEPGGLSDHRVRPRDRAWEIRPRFGSFSTVAGGEVRLAIEADTSPAVYGGPLPLVIDFELESPSFSGALRVERRIDVGLEDISLELMTRFGPEPDGPDVVIYAIVRNTGVSSKTVHLYAGAPGYPRERSAPMPVQPGVPAVKVFSFAGGRDALAGSDIGVGLFIREDGERLRGKVTIDAGL